MLRSDLPRKTSVPNARGRIATQGIRPPDETENSTAPPASNALLAQPRLNACVPHSEALSSLSISIPLCVTRVINLHLMVTSKHTLLCLLEGQSKDHRKRLLNLERMEHTLEDGTVCIEDKLLQNHNVNNSTSKGKFPGLRLDSTKFGPLWLRRLGKTVRRSEDVGVRHDGLNGCCRSHPHTPAIFQ